MAVIWSRKEGIEWAPSDLPDDGLALLSIIGPDVGATPERSTPVLRPQRGPRHTWVLLTPENADVRVNGEHVPCGIRALRDRDLIEVGNHGPMFFSVERLARVTPCPETERAIYCQRCKTKIEPGSMAVECPRCFAWYHQVAALPCWRYTATCSLCPQQTDFEAGYTWRPEDIS